MLDGVFVCAAICVCVQARFMCTGACGKYAYVTLSSKSSGPL